MRCNIDHDIFVKQQKSAALEEEVQAFLKAKKKEQPDQVPFGCSLYVEKCKADGKTPFAFNLRDIMTISVQEAHAERTKKEEQKKQPKPKIVIEPIYRPDTSSDENRILFNRNARKTAYGKGEKKFNGRCKKHGEQIFNIKKDGRDHLCQVCQHHFTHIQNEKRKQLKQVVV